MADDFPEQIKRTLASRVGNRCSNPDCRALTSGPQNDPAKAINLGVAAHITAAAPGGPRFDPDLLPEERRAPSNGIWLCQNCAKLIDNDVVRFPVEVLTNWKSDAQGEAKASVGKTAVVFTNSALDLRIGDLVRMVPIIPRVHEQSRFELKQEIGACLASYKLDSQRHVDIPKSFVERAYRFGDLRLGRSGRLQWLSIRKKFEIFPDKPLSGSAGEYGISKDVDPGYAARLAVGGRLVARDSTESR